MADRDYERDDNGRFASSGGGGGESSKSKTSEAYGSHASTASKYSSTADKSGKSKDHKNAEIAHLIAGAQAAHDNYHGIGDKAENDKAISHHSAEADRHHKESRKGTGVIGHLLNMATLGLANFNAEDVAPTISQALGMIGFSQAVPRSAALFRASLDVSQIESKQVKIRARTGSEACQGYWGRCVHDLSTFRAPERNIVLDFNHKPDTEIGFASGVRVEDGELIADGTLTPFKPDDKASEIIAKGGKGVPYQASVVMALDDELRVEQVPAGKTVVVNGSNFSGPGVVFRNWTIDGIAVCPYGSDSKTSVEFGRGLNNDVVVTFLKDDSIMEKVEIKTATDEAVKPVETPVVKTAETPVAVVSAGDFSRADAMRYKQNFGAAGVEWYMEGKTFEEASRLFSDGQKAEIEALKADKAKQDETIAALTAERDQLKAKGDFHRGQALPVPVKPSESAAAEAEKAQAELKARASMFGRTPAGQSLIDAIQSRMPNASKN